MEAPENRFRKQYGVKITVSAPAIAPDMFVGAVVLVALTDDAIRTRFPDYDAQDGATKLRYGWETTCELAKEAFCGHPSDPSQLSCQFTQVSVDDFEARLEGPGAKTWPNGVRTAILSPFNSSGQTSRKPKDVLANISAISLMLVSFCLSAIALLGVLSAVFHWRTEPFGKGDLIFIFAIASIASLTGWMAYRISRQRILSDGKTYLGRKFIMSFAIFYTLIVVLVVFTSPKGWRFTLCILGPLLILWAARQEFARARE